MNRFWRSALLSVLLPTSAAAAVIGRTPVRLPALPRAPISAVELSQHPATWLATPSGPVLLSPQDPIQALKAPAPKITPADEMAAWLETPSARFFGVPLPQGLNDKRSAPQTLTSFYDGSKLRKASVEVGASDQLPTGAQLFNALHEQSGRGHHEHQYSEATKYLFSTADNVERNGVRGVADLYSNVFTPGRSEHGGDYTEEGGVNNDGWNKPDRMNVEHIWPASFFDPKSPSEKHSQRRQSPMLSDLHHLMPTFIHINEERGHLPFGEVQGRPEYSNSSGAKMGNKTFEPPDASKGRVARAVLYFYTRYHDRTIIFPNRYEYFFRSRLEMFLRWNREHPPTLEEKRRNDLIEKFQGNRNPFIDDYTLVDRVGVAGFSSHPPLAPPSMKARNKRKP